MKHFYWLLLALPACERTKPDSQKTSSPPRSRHVDEQPTATVRFNVACTSGDRLVNGLHDTLHVGRGLVLRLEPGSKSDFAQAPRSKRPYSEAQLIRQEGNGRVNRVGHTLVIRPFNGPVLRFSDDTYQMRRDDKEDLDTRCEFSGSVPGRLYWIVDSLQYERYQPFLINKYSGHATPLWNIPDISPNKQQMLVATPGLDNESSFNGLQLFTISNLAISQLWARELTNWQPQQTRWLDNHTLAIKQVRFEPQERTTYIRLILPK